MSPALVLAAALTLGLLGALTRRAGRRAWLDGLRCLARHGELWRLPALFGVGYALFQLAAAALVHLRLEETFPVAAWGPAPDVPSLAARAWLPAAERTAAGFTIFTATFPLSAWFALLFAGNFGGLLGELTRTLRRRFGLALGVGLLLLVVLGALSAVLKPGLYLFLPEVLAYAPLEALLGVNALASGFELLLGIYFLTYLMLLTHAWRRGLHFEREDLRRLAMRRTGFVLRWSLVILALATGLILLPLSLGLFIPPEDPLAALCTAFAAGIGTPLVAVVAIFLCPVPATLVFHNESLRPALADSRRLLARHWSVILPFLGGAYAAYFALQLAVDYAGVRLGPETAAAFGSRVLAAALEAFLTGWLIASWVCLYKSLAAGRKEASF